MATAAIVPFEVAGHNLTNVQVSVNGFLSNTVTVPVKDSQPGIFTQDSSGDGQASILNQDYSLNSAAHPAKKGSAVMVYTTGLGMVNPPWLTEPLAGARSRVR